MSQPDSAQRPSPGEAMYKRLIAASGKDPETALSEFLDYVAAQNLELYPAQEEAILELYEGKNVILNTPTGSGKSMVAAALHFLSMTQSRRSVYTCPIKALVNEKFLSLCREFGPDQVGMVTGDATVNRDAPILCCTAEILSNISLRDGADSEFDDVIMDEFHYYSDRDRGVAWQIPLLTMKRARFLLMSATIGETEFFESEMTRLTGQPSVTIRSTQRPVPLDFQYYEEPLDKTIQELLEADKAPVYLVHFTQNDCAQSAQNLTSLNVSSKEHKQSIQEALQGVKFTSPYGKDIQKYLRHGIGLHHAGLLPKYRILIEQLAQKGLLKVICGTDTLGVGVNVPIRTVVLTKLCKYDGEKTKILAVRDFHQICGRAGRKGFDDRGWVIALAPEHVTENLKMEKKAADDPKKKKKLVKKKPPEKGYVHWDQKTFEKLMESAPEKLHSRFKVTHGMLLNVLGREGDGCSAMREIIRGCHETDETKRQLRTSAFQLFRSMVERRIIEILPDKSSGSYLRINVHLQEDFSLNQELSLFLLDALPSLEEESEEYHYDLLTLVESILENPTAILRKQLDKARGLKVMELKAQGMEYDDRMEELEKVEYPKPNSEFIYSAFNAFAKEHPWLGQDNIRPKSIAREMFENYYSFEDYIKEYALFRVEGILLRYIAEVYKTLDQTVPDAFKTEDTQEMILYFQAMIRSVDSSLFEEWDRMRRPEKYAELDKKKQSGTTDKGDVKDTPEDLDDITHNPREFTILVRNSVFGFVRKLAADLFETALETVDPSSITPDGEPWRIDLLESKIDPFYEDHEAILLDANARAIRNTFIKKESSEIWRVSQTLVDPEGHNDWAVDFEIDLKKSREAGSVCLKLLNVGPISSEPVQES